MLYILILISAIDGRGISTTTAEFKTKNACVIAGNAVKAKWKAVDADHLVEYVCVAKG